MRHDQRGFTLMEVLLAVALAAGLTVALLQFYWMAMDAREAVQEEIGLVRAARCVMERITRELEAASAAGGGFSGGAASLRFPRTRLPGPAVWVEQSGTDLPLPPEHDVELVGYRLRVEPDEKGALQVVGLERTCQTNVRAQAAVEGTEVACALVASRIRFVNFRYSDGMTWMAGWGGDLPVAVEITLGPDPLPADTEPEAYPYEVFRRVVFVPSAMPREAESPALAAAAPVSEESRR